MRTVEKIQRRRRSHKTSRRGNAKRWEEDREDFQGRWKKGDREKDIYLYYTSSRCSMRILTEKHFIIIVCEIFDKKEICTETP